MHQPSEVQAKLLARITDGDRLRFDSASGRYLLTEPGGKESHVGARTVQSMLDKHLLEQNFMGECRPATA